MKLPFNARKWHAWLSFAVALPILLVAITAILIAHGQALGFRDIKVDPSWLPGYPQANAKREVRAVLHTPDGLWVGTQLGLLQPTAQGLQPVPMFDGQEIRALIGGGDHIFALTQQGLFVQRGEKWERAGRGPVTSAFADNGSVYATFREKGLQRSDDGGRSWNAVADAQAALAQLPPLTNVPVQIPLARLIRDLHTGEALLGHDAEWIWNDIVGGTMAFLGVTGLYLWWRGQRKLVFARRPPLKNSSAAAAR